MVRVVECTHLKKDSTNSIEVQKKEGVNKDSNAESGGEGE